MISPTTITKTANSGSTAILTTAGRFLGLGQGEIQAAQVGLPAWFWITVGAMAGVATGIYIQRTWPQKVDALIEKGK